MKKNSMKMILLVTLMASSATLYAESQCHVSHHQAKVDHGFYDQTYQGCYDPDLATGDDDQCRHPDLQIN